MSTSNKGQRDSIVSLCNVISSTSGKRLNDVFKEKTFHAIVFNESIGLFKQDSQFLSGEVLFADAVDILNEMKPTIIVFIVVMIMTLPFINKFMCNSMGNFNS